MITRALQLIVTSAHYTVIAKALDCEEYLVTDLLKRPGLCHSAFWKKSTTKSFMTPQFFAPEIVIGCLQVRISKNPTLHVH